MVLLIGGVKVNKVPEDSEELYQMAPHLKETGSQFAASQPKQVGAEGLLFVSQREFVTLNKNDENFSIVSTDGCTTCMALIFTHPTSGAVALAHLEEVCVDGISDVLCKMRNLSGNASNFEQVPVQMYIYGSFADDQGFGEELIELVLEHVHREPYEIDLVAACVGILNTVEREDIPWPIVYGVGINIKNGEIFSTILTDKGPDLTLRLSRLFTGSHTLLDVYDNQSGLLRIGPFHYDPIESAQFLLQQSDEFLLQRLSTSPEVEPADFVPEVRSVLKQHLEHPFPDITIFANDRPRCYKKEKNGNWVLLAKSDLQS